MKHNSNQLELFSVIVDKANALIDALNMDRKPKELYFGIAIQKVCEKYLLSIMNKDADVLFNVLDSKGNIPNGGSACWRIWPHIESELNITIDELDNFEVIHLGEVAQ